MVHVSIGSMRYGRISMNRANAAVFGGHPRMHTIFTIRSLHVPTRIKMTAAVTGCQSEFDRDALIPGLRLNGTQ